MTFLCLTTHLSFVFQVHRCIALYISNSTGFVHFFQFIYISSVLPRSQFLIACLFLFINLYLSFCFMLHIYIVVSHWAVCKVFVVGFWSLRIWITGLCDSLFIFVILFKLNYVISRLCDWWGQCWKPLKLVQSPAT